ncbi:aminopeptidase N [Eikenella sp. S3360]|uniref:Aminopeptidase N n=1 Tax=Eikenella glucosivorans TaxID=2766967 RepID=A0ABS0NB60_9NEIS|nr:aminopeptidase N [Eikenella glucosivorans]MBH5329556.1 aminopeptidase N [Eikenella glucosivorans]
MPQQTAKYLKDYRAPEYLVPAIHLDFDIREDHTAVAAELSIEPQTGAGGTLVLQGSAELVSLAVNGQRLPENGYSLENNTLSIPNVPAQPFTLSVATRLQPQLNKSLMGLYESGGNLYTQCEPEGFRKITYHPDRPDVMGVYTTRISADRARYPVLLSNGNRTGSGSLPDNRHWAEWHDPFAKPSYLFALVAGDLVCTRDSFTTKSGRQVALEFFTRAEDAGKVRFGIESLKHAMRWDETRFGLEYDLDIFMVVAVGDFNMGAMENKGLNIFNTACVLADSRSATDADFERVEGVIAHEYFHNWTGNRVTCRDWFQLSLKEGLTVFRDQEFSADRASREVRRIENVSFLRAHQFPEDAGPTAHPVCPASYVEMNNFYTLTVYEKGAEVVRMYHTFLGEAGFQRGMKLYFQRHDGQAVTCDDFRAAMADANGFDFEQFALWYSQAGTPVLEVSGSLQAGNRFVLNIRQSIPPTPDMAAKQPMMIPLKLALFSADEDSFGEQIPFRLPENAHEQTEAVLTLRQAEESIELQFEGAYRQVVPSLLRGFSAPVNLHYAYSDHELSVLLACDSDPFARWEAAQTLYRRAIAANEAALVSGSPLPEHRALLQAIDYVLRADIGAAFQAVLLGVPGEAELWAGRQNIDPLIIHRAREALLDLIASHFAEQFATLNAEARRMEEEQSGLAEPYEYHPQQAGWRALRNVCRAFILRARPAHIAEVAERYPQMAHNMTHEWGILSAVNHNERPERNRLLEQFAAKFRHDDLVMCKYFTLIAASHRADTPAQIQAALAHPAFSLENPNKARALLGSFGRNVPHFHAADGSGYAFLAGQIARIDRFNPQIAARLAQAFNICAQLEPQRCSLMRAELDKLAASPELSKDSGEIIGKILQASA